MRLLPFYYIAACCFFIESCTTSSSEKMTRVSISIYAAQNKKVYLYNVPYAGEKRKLVDSAIVQNVNDSIIFTVPLQEERMYEIAMPEPIRKFYFIADAPYIQISANNINGKYTVNGSQATVSLKKFQEDQSSLAEHSRLLFKKIDSLTKTNTTNQNIDLLKRQLEDNTHALNNNYIAYADTVSNPMAFLIAYDKIDFAYDHKRLKRFIIKAAQRFSQYESVQKLKQDVLAMADIYEKEFNVGDSLPSIELPDISNNFFSTGSMKGKYYLIDFWSTWCIRCIPYNRVKKEAGNLFPKNKFEIISVAIDDNKEIWQHIINRNKYDWIQLIDEKMWQGTAANTLKFDSIPFNFLVSPEGRIMAKAIKADSLLTVLKNNIK